jgi:hypothetical protein
MKFENVDKTQNSSQRKNRNQDQNYLSEETKKIEYIHDQEENPYHKANQNAIKKEDEKFIEIKGDKCYNEINKLLNSNCCLYYYIIILIISFTILIYSIICFFITLSILNFIN